MLNEGINDENQCADHQSREEKVDVFHVAEQVDATNEKNHNIPSAGQTKFKAHQGHAAVNR